MEKLQTIKPNVFLDALPLDCRRSNTDWRYVRYLLPQLIQWQPEINLYLQKSTAVTVQGNWKTIKTKICKTMGYPASMRYQEIDHLDKRELSDSSCNMVFSHRGFPINSPLPVIWQSSILDPEMTHSYLGSDEVRFSEEKDLKHELFTRAALIQVSTEAEALRLGSTFPEIAEKFVPIPFFLPSLKSVEDKVMERHANPSRVEILFVGNDAWRKGLDLLLSAFTSLPSASASRAHLTVITAFDGRSFRFSSAENITFLKKVSHDEVMQRMRRSHVLVNAARFESYGFVFIESMANGCACIGPNWEVQREILGDGSAGINQAPDVDILRQNIERLIHDHEHRWRLAENARTRFSERFSPEIVAAQYAAMFRRLSR